MPAGMVRQVRWRVKSRKPRKSKKLIRAARYAARHTFPMAFSLSHKTVGYLPAHVSFGIKRLTRPNLAIPGIRETLLSLEQLDIVKGSRIKIVFLMLLHL